MEGPFYKFKPGIGTCFVKRHCQISNKAFRYFESKIKTVSGLPLFSVRKNVIKKVAELKVDPNKYIGKGSRLANSPLELQLFNNMFEIELFEDFEDHYDYKY